MEPSVIQPGHWHPASRPDDRHEPSDPTISGRERTLSLAEHLPPKSVSDEPSSLVAVKESLQDQPHMVYESISTGQPEIRLAPPPSTNPLSSSRTIKAGDHDNEIPSDEDSERFDPAWGFSRSNTEQILSSANRSTTFPSVVSTTSASETVSEFRGNGLAKSSDEGSLDLVDKPDGLPQPLPNGEYLAEPREIGDIMGQRNLANLITDLEDPADARYDEGVPLIPPEDANLPVEAREPQAEASKASVAFAEDDKDPSFFNNLNDPSEHSNHSPSLERKSTSAVLDNLDFQPQVDSKPVDTQPDISHAFATDPGAEDETNFFSQPAAEKEVQRDDPEDVWKAMVDDDDEFLVEDADDLLPDSDPGSPSSFIASVQHDPTQPTGLNTQMTPPSAGRPGVSTRQSSSNPYAPHQPSTSEISQLSPTAYGNIGFSRPGLAPMNSFQSHLQTRPAAPQQAESFADQSKGGYKSPYDLPTELSKPRKRAQVLQLAPTTKAVPPPPRTSSITDKQLQSPFTPNPPAFPNTPLGPATQAPQQAPRTVTASVPPSNRPKPQSSSTSFFEELPITTKPRPVSIHGRYTPQQTSNINPLPSLPPESPPHLKALPPQPQLSPPRQTDPYAQFQLRQPERLDPFSNVPLQPTSSVPVPASTRYSPAPPSAMNLPRTGPSPRYSPAPPSQTSAPPALNRYASHSSVPNSSQQHPAVANRYVSQPPPTQPPAPQLPFQPRTSSPLVHHKASIDESSYVAALPPATQIAPHQQGYQPQAISSSPTGLMYGSPNKAPGPLAAMAPRRSQTQSPSKQHSRPTIPMPPDDGLNRPASAHGQMSPVKSYAQMEMALPPRPAIQARGLVEELEFLQPNDEMRSDILQRWKGAPIFHFGFGGTIVTTFPKRIPRYGAGSARPQIKPTVGDVSIRGLKDVLALPEQLSSFPGPLRTKSKKKELVTWLSATIAKFEADASAISSILQAIPDPRKRHEEKILLWKIVRSIVEHDGLLDGSVDALKSVNAILAPEIHAVDEATATQYRADMMTSGIYRPSGANVRADAVDPMAMETLRKHLLRGNRQEAVWHAVDNRLWSHALLIASKSPLDTWKQVVQEFVKQEVKTAGANTESLSALYEIFGGNLDECIDQLVPPSARAGLQMVSKIEQSGPSKNALDGLDRWRETLSLVINNRSQGDHQALAALGRLLADYGRIEAAHVCFLLSKNPVNPNVLGGSDDPQASITLLGSDSRQQPYDFARDQDAIVLTEVYEFATLVLGGITAMPFFPYLSPYKLQRATILAERGAKTEAQAYCDTLTSTVNKSTKMSSYYHPVFLGELEDFQNRLKQIPVQSSGSWMAKPNLEKVSGNLFSRLSNFVAGDDSDAESKGSAKEAAEAGPFANVAGTPSLSRTGSQSDIYAGYPSTSLPNLPATIAGSRYAPNGISSARSSSELTRGRPSLDSQRSPPQSSHARSPYEPVNMFQQSQAPVPVNPYQAFGSSPPTNRYQSTPPQSSYIPNTAFHESPAAAPMPVRQDSYIPTPPPEQQQQELYQPKPIEVPDVAPLPYEQPSYGGFMPPTQDSALSGASEPVAGSGAYEPPAQSYGYGYDPPSDAGYVPYTPEPDSPEQPKPKKKSFMDTDDFPRTSVPQPSTTSAPRASTDSDAARKSANDAAADAAFRAAAEADAKAAEETKAAKKSSGWFGGLWGGKKEESLDAQPSAKGGAEPKVYKAKLGESKMKLYYDKDLKKWVNPDNPDAATKTATPPPPRAPNAVGAPPRMGPPTSSPMPPPSSSPAMGSGPPSRQGTPANGSAPVSATLPLSTQSGLGLAPPPGPPSRPGTAMSNASSIDDLLGPGPPGGGRKSVKGKKGGKGGRYVDVMAK